MGVRRVIHSNIKDKGYHSHSLFFLSINTKTSSFPPNSIKPLKTDRQHDCTCFLVFVLWININIFPMSSKHRKIKHCYPCFAHSANYFQNTPLFRGPLGLYTSVWVTYEAAFNTNVNQPWFIYPQQSNGQSPLLYRFYISPADRLPSSCHENIWCAAQTPSVNI